MSNLAHAQSHDDQTAHPISALALVETVTAVQVFSENGLDPLIERIEQEVRTTALDISTPKGRKEIASLAHKIAKSKTALDEMGKKLVAGWKDQAKKVDVERARAWDRLEGLQKEIRQPLTDWENRDKDRIAKHEAKLAEIVIAGSHTAANWQNFSVEVMNDRLKELLSDKTDWQEFSVRAKLALEAATDAIAAAILKRQKHDSEMAELARLRKEEEERKQRAHEEKIARAAAEQARLLAEEEARKVSEVEAARVRAEQEKAEKERQRIQREKEESEAKAKKAPEEASAREERMKWEKAEAEARAAKAENDRIASKEKAKENTRIAAANAAMERDAAEKAAAQRERDRIEAEKRELAAATAKREANAKHRAKIDAEAADGLLRAVIVSGEDEFAEIAEEALARRIVAAIASGKIPHVSISY
jgi:hypothetical protein